MFRPGPCFLPDGEIRFEQAPTEEAFTEQYPLEKLGKNEDLG